MSARLSLRSSILYHVHRDVLNYLVSFRYITSEELEQALREFGMLEGRDIKEILSEVDSDNVRLLSQFDPFPLLVVQETMAD